MLLYAVWISVKVRRCVGWQGEVQPAVVVLESRWAAAVAAVPEGGRGVGVLELESVLDTWRAAAAVLEVVVVDAERAADVAAVQAEGQAVVVLGAEPVRRGQVRAGVGEAARVV